RVALTRVAATSAQAGSFNADAITAALRAGVAVCDTRLCKVAVPTSVFKRSCGRKKTRCRVPFLGRQRRQDRGMSAPPGATLPGCGNASTGAENADSTGLARARTFYCSRPDPGPVGPDLRAPARGLGCQRHQDRATAGARNRRSTRRTARGPGFPEPSPQQAQHDAEPE